MRKSNLCAVVCISLVAVWVVSCAKQKPPEAPPATTAKPVEAVQAPSQPEQVAEVGLAEQAPAEAKARANPTKADAASLEDGKTLYTHYCAECHGVKGDRKGPVAAKFSLAPADLTNKKDMGTITDGTLFWVITEGPHKGGQMVMPGFGISTTDEEIWHIVDYIRTFSK